MSLKRTVSALERLVGRRRKHNLYDGPLAVFDAHPGKYFRVSDDGKELLEIAEDQIHPDAFFNVIIQNLDPREIG